MANIENASLLNTLNSDFRKVVDAILAEVPSIWNSYSLKVFIVQTRRSEAQAENLRESGIPAAKNSRHLWGGAVDFKFVLNGMPVGFPGGYGHYSKTAKITIPKTNTQVSAHDLWAVVGEIAERHGCKWGGNFRTSPYDPIHFQSPQCAPPDGSKTQVACSDEDDEDIIVYSDAVTFGASESYSSDAGSSSKVESGSAVVHPENTVLYIGYDLTLSDFSSLIFKKKSLKELLDASNVDGNVASSLVKLSGLKGKDAYVQYNSNPNISITQDNADAIFATQLEGLLAYLTDQCGFALTKYPSEISTAIASFFFGKNMATPVNANEVSEIQAILINSKGNYRELAAYIESKTVGLGADLKARRDREAALIRSYNIDNDGPKGAPLPGSISSTGTPEDYAGEANLLKLQLQNQLDGISDILNSRKSSTSTPASSEYDDSFNDIDQSTLDAVASIMQSQQVNTDVFFGFKETEYRRRVKTKNFYSILSRKLNSKIAKLENLMTTEPSLKDHSEYTVSGMYAMIPYANSMGYEIKKNAVKRCEYRIRMLEKQIKDHEMGLIGYGVPSVDSFADVGVFLLTLPLKFTANIAITLVNDITDLFSSVTVLREMITLEKGNLINLRKDMNRYS